MDIDYRAMTTGLKTTTVGEHSITEQVPNYLELKMTPGDIELSLGTASYELALRDLAPLDRAVTTLKANGWNNRDIAVALAISENRISPIIEKSISRMESR